MGDKGKYTQLCLGKKSLYMKQNNRETNECGYLQIYDTEMDFGSNSV